MEINKEIILKIKALAKIRRQIKRNKKYAFLLSLQDPEEFDNPYKDEIEFLKLQEILLLQEIQYLKRQVNPKASPIFSITFQGGF